MSIVESFCHDIDFSVSSFINVIHIIVALNEKMCMIIFQLNTNY